MDDGKAGRIAAGARAVEVAPPPPAGSTTNGGRAAGGPDEDPNRPLNERDAGGGENHAQGFEDGAEIGPARGAGGRTSDELVEVVYDQLRALAGGYLKRERTDIALEPSMLVHETYVRLKSSPGRAWVDEKHFLSVAAIAMRRVLVDHARRRRALKRGFGHARVGMDNVSGPDDSRTVDITEIDDALRKLEARQPRQAKVVELRFFAGLNHEQIATVLGVSRKTVVADWGKAREWLSAHLG